MIKKFLEFKYKGERRYVHGTDIINKTIILLNHLNYFPDTFEISFKNVINSSLEIDIYSKTEYNDKIASNSKVEALANFKHKKNIYYIVYKRTKNQITGVYNFDEKFITRKTILKLEKKSAIYSFENKYSVIEIIVAINKHLLNHIFPDKSGKWYFGKLSLEKNVITNKFSKIKIMVIKNIGVRYTKSLIEVDGVEVGFIFFSMKLK